MAGNAVCKMGVVRLKVLIAFSNFFAKVLNAMKVLLPATRSPRRVCHVACTMRHSLAVAVKVRI